MVAKPGRWSIVWCLLAPCILVASSLAEASAMDRQGGEPIGIQSLPNLRDLGGYKAEDGRVVRPGLVYRSNQLNPVSAGDLDKIDALGIRTSFDLRTRDERAAHPDQLPPGTADVWLDVLADAPDSGPAQLQAVLAQPAGTSSPVIVATIDQMFEVAYRDFVSLPSARQSYRTLFLALGDQDEGPALFHCTAGKDRTGWAAAALLMLLGVSEEDVLSDFLESNDRLLPAYRGEIDAFAANGGDRAVAEAILGVRANYLAASLAEMREKYGTVQRYFSDGLGIDAEGQELIRSRLLAPAT